VSESGCLCRREGGRGVWRDLERVDGGCGQLLPYAPAFVFCAPSRLRAMRAGGIVACMRHEPLRDPPAGDRGDEAQTPSAARGDQLVQSEDTLHDRGPCFGTAGPIRVRATLRVPRPPAGIQRARRVRDGRRAAQAVGNAGWRGPSRCVSSECVSKGRSGALSERAGLIMDIPEPTHLVEIYRRCIEACGGIR